MGRLLCGAVAGVVLGGAVAGCSSADGPRYVERVLVAAPNSRESRVEYERPKPMPEPWDRLERERSPAPPAELPTPERDRK